MHDLEGKDRKKSIAKIISVVSSLTSVLKKDIKLVRKISGMQY